MIVDKDLEVKKEALPNTSLEGPKPMETDDTLEKQNNHKSKQLTLDAFVNKSKKNTPEEYKS